MPKLNRESPNTSACTPSPAQVHSRHRTWAGPPPDVAKKRERSICSLSPQAQPRCTPGAGPATDLHQTSTPLLTRHRTCHGPATDLCQTYHGPPPDQFTHRRDSPANSPCSPLTVQVPSRRRTPTGLLLDNSKTCPTMHDFSVIGCDSYIKWSMTFSSDI